MLNAWRKIMDMLDARERRGLWKLLVLVLVMGIANMLGVAVIIPFLSVLGNPEATAGDGTIGMLYRAGGFETPTDFQMAFGIAVLVVFLGSVIIRSVAAWALFRYSAMRTYSIAARILRSYLGQPYVWFLGRHSADLVKMVMGETNLVVKGVLTPMLEVISNGTIAVAMVLLLVLANPLAAAMMFAILGGSYALMFLWVRKRQTAAGRARFEANSACYRVVQEAMIGSKEIKVLGLERQVLARFHEPALERARAESINRTMSEVPRHLLEGIAFGGMIIVLLVLLDLNDGDLAAVLPTAGVYALAGARMMPAMQTVYRGMAAIRYQTPTLDALHAEVVSSATAGERLPPRDVPQLHLREALEMRDLEYAYPNAERPALQGVSLRIEAGMSIGIVGGTGAGKSTAMDVLLGLLEPKGGEMIVDGTPVKDLATRRAWRRSIGYVPQQIFLTDDTVASNIAFGLPKDQIDMAAVERAARMAELHDFVTTQLPDGYLTQVGDRGARLSGGQRQRVGIARALYHDPDVLILDEATSALDNVTERAVMDAMDRISSDKTVIMVAHRLSTVRNCNRIFLFQHGTIAASGTYDELLETSEAFQAMVRAVE